MIRYVLHPGPVAGPFGRDPQHIDAGQLASLYGVEPSECVVAPDYDADWATWPEPPGAIHLRPRADGNYQLPTTNQKPGKPG